METCRMYREEYPEEKQLVYVRVKEITDMYAYVELLEYNNIRGMILLSQLTRKNRIRSLSKYIKVGKTDVMIVLSVDESKGEINLSKRRIDPEEIEDCEKRYMKSRSVQSILKNVSISLGIPLGKLYESFAWNLADQYGSIHSAFTLISRGDEDAIAAVPENIQECLVKTIVTRMTQQEVKVEVKFDLTCFEFDGVAAIQKALKAGESCSSDDMTVVANLIAPPTYSLNTMTFDKKDGQKLLQTACKAVQESIESNGGDFNLR